MGPNTFFAAAVILGVGLGPAPEGKSKANDGWRGTDCSANMTKEEWSPQWHQLCGQMTEMFLSLASYTRNLGRKLKVDVAWGRGRKPRTGNQLGKRWRQLRAKEDSPDLWLGA